MRITTFLVVCLISVSSLILCAESQQYIRLTTGGSINDPLTSYRLAPLAAVSTVQSVAVKASGTTLYVYRTDTATPIQISSMGFSYNLRRLTLVNNTVLLSSEYSTFYIVDISDPIAPKQVGIQREQPTIGAVVALLKLR